MRSEIENFTPQHILKNQKKQAVVVWVFFACFAACIVFLIILAPLAQANNLTYVSAPIYKTFGYICHQMPTRSFHLEDHSFAVCARCFGIYVGILFGFFVYPVIRSIEEIEPLPRFWLFLALIPMGIDWSLGFFEIWENTHYSRFLTGLILGAACAVFIIPALVELSRLILSKRQIKRLSC